jgi:hypothetical protein
MWNPVCEDIKSIQEDTHQQRLDKVLSKFNAYEYFKTNDERVDELHMIFKGVYTCEGLDIYIGYWYDYKDKYKGRFTLSDNPISLDTVESLLKDLEVE